MLNSRRILYKFYIFLRFWINILHKRVFIGFLIPHYFARTICTVDTIINIIITPSIIYIGQIGYPSTRLLTPTSISRAVTRTLIPPIIIMAILYNLSLFSSVTATGKFRLPEFFPSMRGITTETRQELVQIQGFFCFHNYLPLLLH